VGVPVVLGSKGMERVVPIKMTPAEAALMAESVSHVKDLVGTVQKMFPELS
jgi:malate/lactate dehydrogenase